MVTTVSGEGEGPYKFTAPWHTNVMDNWAKQLAPYKGKQGLRYLEIGVFEGRSLLWMFENVLTDPSCTATAIDVFMADYEETFDANVKASPATDRITKIKAPSREALRAMSKERFDVIYIDGSHTADDVMIDAALSWDLLEVGGLLIFDDYEWTGRPKGLLPMELRPKIAVDLFITAYRGELELIDRGYQVFVKKVENPCKPKDYCTPLGRYQYYWRDVELRRADGSKVELTPEEIRLVETIAQAKGIGMTKPHLPPNVRQSEPFRALVKRLELDIPTP